MCKQFSRIQPEQPSGSRARNIYYTSDQRNHNQKRIHYATPANTVLFWNSHGLMMPMTIGKAAATVCVFTISGV